MAFEPQQVAPGLWRWTAPHPEWRPSTDPDSPAAWDRDVGCVLYVAGDAAVFVDPLLPPETDVFWSWADDAVAGRAVAVLTTIKFHRRSRDEVAGRYGASTSRAKAAVPEGVEPVAVRGAGETMFWLPGERTLIPGDRILGADGGGLRLCPDSWMRYLSSKIRRPDLAERLRPLLDLPIERVLVSHGEPVLRGGHAALAAALSAG
jgi:hypothetical protein